MTKYTYIFSSEIDGVVDEQTFEEENITIAERTAYYHSRDLHDRLYGGDILVNYELINEQQ